MLVANGGARTPSGALAHFLAAYCPAELALARSDYLRPPLSPRAAPRSSLSLRVDSAELAPLLRARTPHSVSVHTLRRQARAHEPVYDALPSEPIPPPELFDF